MAAVAPYLHNLRAARRAGLTLLFACCCSLPWPTVMGMHEVGLSLRSGAGVQQAPPGRNPLLPEAKALMRQAAAAVGLILVSDGEGDEPRPRGSGVVLKPDGMIVTNWHVIARDNSDQPYQEIYFGLAPDSGTTATGAMRYRLQIAEVERKLDLALLRVVIDARLADKAAGAGQNTTPLNLSAIEIGDSRAVELFDDLAIIGFPNKGGTTPTVSRGIIEGTDSVEGWIKTDSRLLHGNSGGAAVNAAGKLIGIATKVEVDLTHNAVQLGAVGYLRPAHIIEALLERFREKERATLVEIKPSTSSTPGAPAVAPSAPPVLVKVSGWVKQADDGKPIAGARVGLIIAGREVTPETLIAWSGTNAEGRFQLEKPVPPGRYTLRAKVVGDERYAVYNREVEITSALQPLTIEIQTAKKQ